MINLFNTQIKQARPFVKQPFYQRGILVILGTIILLAFLWFGCEPKHKKCADLRRNWDRSCPGFFQFYVIDDNGVMDLLDSTKLYQLPLKFLDNRGNRPEGLDLFYRSDVEFVAKPGCGFSEENLGNQVFRDTFYLWIPTAKGYDVDTIHLLYEFGYNEECGANYWKYASLTYNGLEDDKPQKPPLPAIRGRKRK
jgi:hypothetical protein